MGGLKHSPADIGSVLTLYLFSLSDMIYVAKMVSSTIPWIYTRHRYFRDAASVLCQYRNVKVLSVH